MKQIDNIINLFYPNTCRICGRTLSTHENYLCLHCIQNIPRTDFHIKDSHPAEQLFRGKIEIEEAFSFFYFTPNSNYRQLIHQIKYNGEKHCGQYMGTLFAQELVRDGKLQDIDIIIPVPLHRSKERRRGYNQSEWIAKGIANVIHKNVNSHLLYRKRKNESQIYKSLYDRWLNTQQTFQLDKSTNIEDKHILLIDDVVTTGATLLACAEALSGLKNCKLSLLTLAITQ